MKSLKCALATAAALLMTAACVSGLLIWLDRTYPPPLENLERSVELVDRSDTLLRAFATSDGRWRLEPPLEALDATYLDMLVAYEDRRFWDHTGVDYRALLRAAGQLIANRSIVSGGSTITMQLARLLEPRSGRTIAAKMRQTIRAVQIERRLSKRQILQLYLTLAPYGGNLEGVRAASLAWFGKEPRRLTLAEAALLVALPQAPESRRPDRNAQAAKGARDRVLARMAEIALISPGDVARAMQAAIPTRRRPLPALAAHLAERARQANPGSNRLRVTLDARLQQALASVAQDTAGRIGPRISVAMIMTDARTGQILAEVGSPHFADQGRSGWIDMTRAVRSPGSTLKPFIYALAFEDGLIAQETLIADRPAAFGPYRPRNFDMAYQGDVTIRQALQMSLNIPAIKLLQAVGPLRLTGLFRRAGITAHLPPGETPGLAIGLGGIGISLHDLVQLYGTLAARGQPMALGDGLTSMPAALSHGPLFHASARWQVADILSGTVPPEGAWPNGIAYKTGTSYGYRDAWAVGFDGRHVLGVWVGRPDGGPVPGISGYVTAAPALFEGFSRAGLGITPLPPASSDTARLSASRLPASLRRFSAPGTLVELGSGEPPPQIVYPPDGAQIDLGARSGEPRPIVLKINGGRAPFRWLANGQPLPRLERRRTSSWLPDGAGSSTLTVLDASGRAASVRVVVQ